MRPSITTTIFLVIFSNALSIPYQPSLVQPSSFNDSTTLLSNFTGNLTAPPVGPWPPLPFLTPYSRDTYALIIESYGNTADGSFCIQVIQALDRAIYEIERVERTYESPFIVDKGPMQLAVVFMQRCTDLQLALMLVTVRDLMDLKYGCREIDRGEFGAYGDAASTGKFMLKFNR